MWQRIGGYKMFNVLSKIRLGNDNFWYNYTLSSSPGDGHCLVHSVHKCMNHLGKQIKFHDILDTIENETHKNAKIYKAFMNGNCTNVLIGEMKAYIYEKRYDSWFGDIVPYIIANGLKVTIIIFSKSMNYNLHIIGNNDCSADCPYIFLYKEGMHYDAIIHMKDPNDVCTIIGAGSNIVSKTDTRVTPITGVVDYTVDGDSSSIVHKTNTRVVPIPGVVHDKNVPNYLHLASESTTSRTLQIVFWNINGLNQDKLSDMILGKLLKNYDIILLCETWASENDDFTLEGYDYFNYPRRYCHPKCKRDSGGLGIFIKSSLKHGIKTWRNTDDVVAWFVIDKSLTGLEHDTYIACVYIVPEYSTYQNHNEYEILLDDISRIPGECEILICGDYNSRTNVISDIDASINGCDGDLDNLVPLNHSFRHQVIESMYAAGKLPRFSMDKAPMNKYGSRLIEFCKVTDMLIFNGRLGDDFGVGEFTRDDTTGRSVVDYAIGTPVIYNSVLVFKVLGKFPESDHRALSIALGINSENVSPDKGNRPEWHVMHKYIWSQRALDDLQSAMFDDESVLYHNKIIECICNLDDVNAVANRFDQYMSQACDRVLTRVPCTRKNKKRGPAWYDSECRLKRSLAIRAGERVTNPTQRENQLAACREYRATKQRKQRKFLSKCIDDINSAFTTNRTDMWRTINRMCHGARVTDEPSDDAFYDYFKCLNFPKENDYFIDDLENIAIDFLNEYDNCTQRDIDSSNDTIVDEILNNIITSEEVSLAISSLKINRSAGIDGIPAEFVKACKQPLNESITMVLNYIIESREFPDTWAGGLRSAVFKSGKQNIVDNFRGITILPIMEKIFESVVYRRLTFINETFQVYDKFNNGFISGSRTSDNLFILNGLIEKQLLMGKKLYACFIDFSKAFDLINRTILFYKLIKNGWKGKLIDTFRSLYRKTHFRVKRNGKLSPPLLSNIGVNQGGIASGLMFRKYMSDLSDYLFKEFGVVIEDVIIAHILWADDLILFSDSAKGIQRQLDGLRKFCASNKVIVNEIKTKSMCFGADDKVEINFNGKPIEQVQQFKYLGTVVRSIKRRNQNIFSENSSFICTKARKATFSIQKKVKFFKLLPPEIRFEIFDTLIKPILTYGSDVWGINKTALHELDKSFLNYIRCVLCVKSTTSNIIVFGECGKFPPSMYCHVNVLCYMHRLLNMQSGQVVKSVFDSLHKLNNQGFHTWVSKAYELGQLYGTDIDSCSELPSDQFKQICNERLKNCFITSWLHDLHSCNTSIIRTYRSYKLNFGMECYLKQVNNSKFRVALSKLRTSSHSLEIERGRYTRPKLNVDQRLCMSCNVVEDEEHFVLHCQDNRVERELLFQKTYMRDSSFFNLSSFEQFVFLMRCSDPQIMAWFGKFIHHSFLNRNILRYNARTR